MASVTAIPSRARAERHGLPFWMGRVCDELARLRHASGEDEIEETVHDLRVAIRRCRSLAAVLQEVDPSPPWEELRRKPRKLFRALGTWRDAQVLAGWAEKLAPAGDPARTWLSKLLQERAARGRAEALRAARKFDEVEWKQLERVVRRRARVAPLDGPAAQCLALERLEEARELHARALRSSQPGPWHRLRIGLKRFRYTVENLLPGRCSAWENNLKRLQDLLGDLHDLDVLGDLLESEGERIPSDSAEGFKKTLQRERKDRILSYRQLTLGKTGLWHIWRSALPNGTGLEPLVNARLRATARALDPQPRRTAAISQLGLRLFDAFGRAGVSPLLRDAAVRRVFRASAQLLGVERGDARKVAHKAARSLLMEMPVPPGWSSQEWELVGWIIRYHRGREPRQKQRRYAALPEEGRRVVEVSAGLLRLARALRRHGVESAHGLRTEPPSAEAIFLRVPGWASALENEPSLAKAKRLLEGALGRLILLLPAERAETARLLVEDFEAHAVAAPD
jgi:CHAD domain-containing protein